VKGFSEFPQTLDGGVSDIDGDADVPLAGIDEEEIGCTDVGLAVHILTYN
jgi:hypothetical protein